MIFESDLHEADAGDRRAHLPLELRRVPSRVLVAMELAGRVKSAPIITRGQNTRGWTYSQMWTQLPDGRWQSLYLGALSPDDESLLRDLVVQRRGLSPAEYHRRVRRLRAERRHLRELAQQIAAAAGFHFRGCRLLREKR